MAYEPEFCPKLRPIDVFPFDWQGQKSLLLRDPQGYSDDSLVVPAILGPLLSLMDGQHNLRDLQASASKILGRLVMFEELEGLVRTLEEHHFLEGERFERRKQELEAEFLAQKTRPPSHAGRAYPASSQELRYFLGAILAQDQKARSYRPRVIIAPHIDLSSGAKGFAAAYSGLSWPKGARVVVLGTGHFLESLLSVLDKDFATPLGLVPCDRDFLEALFGQAGRDLRGHVWGHRSEHAIEFQVIFLQYLLEDFRLVPILCGSPEIYLEKEKEIFESLVHALKELLDEETYLVVGVDFCHLGLRYGDPHPALEGEKKKALSFDRLVLEKVFALDAEGLFSLLSTNPHYKVCGFGPLYLLLRVLEGKKLKGELLHQEVVDFGPGSIVSFAAAALFDEG